MRIKLPIVIPSIAVVLFIIVSALLILSKPRPHSRPTPTTARDLVSKPEVQFVLSNPVSVSTNGWLLQFVVVYTVDNRDDNFSLIGLVSEDFWRDGKLLIPAGSALVGPDRELRPDASESWILFGSTGGEMSLKGFVLRSPRDWGVDCGGVTNGFTAGERLLLYVTNAMDWPNAIAGSHDLAPCQGCAYRLKP